MMNSGSLFFDFSHNNFVFTCLCNVTKKTNKTTKEMY